jgi:glycosyltransferase involved in cell wall biosynthesis
MARTLCWIAHRDPTHPSAGGAEKSILEIARGLDRRGWTVHLLAGGYPGASPQEQVGPIHVHRGKSPVSLHLELPSLLAECGTFDVVVEDLGHVVPFLAERFVSAPGIVFFRHLHRRTLPGQVRPISANALEAIERAYPFIYTRWPLVAPSTSALEDLEKLGFKTSRLQLIPYGVDSDTFRPGPLTDAPSLIHFSGLRAYKRAADAIDLMAQLRERGREARLTIVGRGKELDRLKDRARSLALSSRVEFTGWIPVDDLASRVRQSWVHVQCSTAEGWGLTAWEAAASGVPTVAYRVPGLVDSVEVGVTGLLVEDGNVDALTDSVVTVFQSRSEWTTRCRQSVALHSWDETSARWDQLLRETADGYVRRGTG